MTDVKLIVNGEELSDRDANGLLLIMLDQLAMIDTPLGSEWKSRALRDQNITQPKGMINALRAAASDPSNVAFGCECIRRAVQIRRNERILNQ